MLLVIDNYDSFTYNLVQYFGELGQKMEVVRNDKMNPGDILDINPAGIVVSPGPCTPFEAGISMDVIRQYSGKYPILGVCLGHQSIGAVFGGNVIRAERLMHGKTSEIHHDNSGVFEGISNPFIATRYHSLIVERSTFPEKILEMTAWTDEGEIMGIRHMTFPTFGVQFHPESILTREGKQILTNFLKIIEKWKQRTGKQ